MVEGPLCCKFEPSLVVESVVSKAWNSLKIQPTNQTLSVSI